MFVRAPLNHRNSGKSQRKTSSHFRNHGSSAAARSQKAIGSAVASLRHLLAIGLTVCIALRLLM